MGDAEFLDCVVVGAGPAGLTAAIYLGRFRRNFRVLESASSRAAWIPRSHNLPGYPDGIRGKTLLARMRRQAEKYGARIDCERVERLTPIKGGFEIRTATEVLRARTAILATGVIDNIPDIPGLEDGVARGLVRICPICDGYEVIGKTVGLIGEDDHCAREALFLKTYTDDIAFIHIGKAPLPPETSKMLADAGVELIESAEPAVVIEQRRITAFDFGAGEPRRFDVVYSALGLTPRASLAEQAGAELKEGRLVVNDHQETSVPGLYAAGDVVRGLNQISTAEGEAATAATDIHNRLRQGR